MAKGIEGMEIKSVKFEKSKKGYWLCVITTEDGTHAACSGKTLLRALVSTHKHFNVMRKELKKSARSH